MCAVRHHDWCTQDGRVKYDEPAPPPEKLAGSALPADICRDPVLEIRNVCKIGAKDSPAFRFIRVAERTDCCKSWGGFLACVLVSTMPHSQALMCQAIHTLQTEH